MQEIKIRPLTKEDFAPFGDLLDLSGEPDKIINQGNCGRYHNRAGLDFIDGAAGISLFDAKPRALPYELEMMERHPLGSQAFIPMNYAPFLIIAALDNGGTPGLPMAFLSTSGQAINFHRNVWHGVLTPLNGPGLFAVVDRIGEGANLEEVFFDTPYLVVS
jgi:ureidoglycolate lyase